MELRMKFQGNYLEFTRSSMDVSFHDYCLQPPSRGHSEPRFDSYLDTSEYNQNHRYIAPSRSRTSTPLMATERARKDNHWSRSIEHGTYQGRTKSRDSPPPIRSRSSSPSKRFPTWQPSRLVEMERDNFQDALDDSESRRQVLLKKLADAQKTMEIQNERLLEGEVRVAEYKTTVATMQQRQAELEVKIQSLQKERDDFYMKSKQDNEEKEAQRQTIDDVNNESSRLRNQLDMVLTDKQQHQVTLKHLHKTIKDLQSQVEAALEINTSTSEELDITKQQLDVAKQRAGLLDEEKSHLLSELEESQKARHTLITRSTDLGHRLHKSQTNLKELSESTNKTNRKYDQCTEELAVCRAKLRKQNNDFIELKNDHFELLSSRDRMMKQNAQLENTLQSLEEINEELSRTKIVHEDDIRELEAYRENTQRELLRLSEESVSTKERLVQSKQNSEKLTEECHQLQIEVESLEKKIKVTTETLKINVHRMEQAEAQNSQLIRERQDLRTELSALQNKFDDLEEFHKEKVDKLKKEAGDLKTERDKANSQCEVAQAQYARINDEIETNNQHITAQLDHWRQACSKLTSLVDEKDKDLRECATQRKEVEEKCALLEVQRRSLEVQLNEAQGGLQELELVRNEHKRLAQECAENKQLICMLEMQRDVLAKSPSKTNPTENISKALIGKLQAELSLVKEKLKDTKLERDNLVQNKSYSSGETLLRDNKFVHDDVTLKGVNQKLAEELSQLRQESETLRRNLQEKTWSYDRDVRDLNREKQQLDLRLASMVDELCAFKSDQARKTNDSNSESKSLKAEIQWLQQDLNEKNQQLTIIKGECLVLENGKKRAEDRICILEESLDETKRKGRFSPIKEVDARPLPNTRINDTKLQAAVAENALLKTQLDEMESLQLSQNTTIKELKRRLEETKSALDHIQTKEVATGEVKSLKRDLQRAHEDIELRESRINELMRKFLVSQRLEQKAREERDTLRKIHGTEPQNDSSQHLLKQVAEMREEKLELEKQLNLLTTKTCQTPPLSLTEDRDSELANQYHKVCEHNKWLESQTESLRREVELVRDQNSLLQEQRNDAVREATRLRDEMKDLQREYKGKHRQNKKEISGLGQSDAAKMQKILELERGLCEKKQLVRVMTEQIETLQKKADKGKISSFMKKLRRNGESNSEKNTDESLDLSTSANGSGNRQLGLESSTSTFDPGYSSFSLPQTKSTNSLPPNNRSSEKPPKISRSSSQSPQSNRLLLTPLSSTLNCVTNSDDGTENRIRQRSQGGRSSSQKVSFVESLNATHDKNSFKPRFQSDAASYTDDSEEDHPSTPHQDLLQPLGEKTDDPRILGEADDSDDLTSIFGSDNSEHNGGNRV